MRRPDHAIAIAFGPKLDACICVASSETGSCARLLGDLVAGDGLLEFECAALAVIVKAALVFAVVAGFLDHMCGVGRHVGRGCRTAGSVWACVAVAAVAFWDCGWVLSGRTVRIGGRHCEYSRASGDRAVVSVCLGEAGGRSAGIRGHDLCRLRCSRSVVGADRRLRRRNKLRPVDLVHTQSKVSTAPLREIVSAALVALILAINQVRAIVNAVAAVA